MMVCVDLWKSKVTFILHYDHPAAEVQVAISTLMITEGSGDTLCVSLTATSGSPTSLEDPLTVNVTTNLNAESGLAFQNINIRLFICHCFHTVAEDFLLSGTNITIPAGPIPTANCVTVTIIDDDILERSEGFDVGISGTDLAQVSVGASDTTTVTINDNDGMCGFMEVQSYVYPAL